MVYIIRLKHYERNDNIYEKIVILTPECKLVRRNIFLINEIEDSQVDKEDLIYA